jgi:RNA polymerase sigma factor (sigma-70 family)
MNIDASDRELLSRLHADPVAFEVFYRRHVDRVMRFTATRVSNAADAADLTAATFVTLLTSASNYDPERGEPTAWLLGISARLIANAHRRHGREWAAVRRLGADRLLSSDDIDRLEDGIDASRAHQAVLRAMDGLRPNAREALLLVSDEGLSPSQAARLLDVSAAAFRMRLTVARRALARALERQGDDTTKAPDPTAEFDGRSAPTMQPTMQPTMKEVIL